MELQWHDALLLVVPGLIAIITKPGWPGSVKYLVAIGACILASLVEFYLTIWLAGEIQTSFMAEFAKSFLIIFGTYAGIWKPTGAADTVENKING